MEREHIQVVLTGGGWWVGGWYMCSHVESNVASFSPGFSKHCVLTIIVLIVEQLSDSC